MPKEPKQTKEDLLVELTKLKESVSSYQKGDVGMRREFCKAFGWPRDSGSTSYSYDRGDNLPSWIEIFVEIGRLKSCSDYKNLEQNVKHLDNDIREIIQREQERNGYMKIQGIDIKHNG